MKSKSGVCAAKMQKRCICRFDAVSGALQAEFVLKTVGSNRPARKYMERINKNV